MVSHIVHGVVPHDVPYLFAGLSSCWVNYGVNFVEFCFTGSARPDLHPYLLIFTPSLPEHHYTCKQWLLVQNFLYHTFSRTHLQEYIYYNYWAPLYMYDC